MSLSDAQIDLDSALRENFGHPAFRDGQKQVVENLLDGRSALAVFPTGGGKSICYQLPAILLDGLTLVISPLIALMREQVEMLKARGIAAARLDSTLTAAEVMEIYDAMSNGSLRLLYIAPERLVNESFVQRLKRCKLALMAVDEAHCISEWGHNFRPDYLRLAAMARKLRIPRVLALTATATPEVAADIRREFKIQRSDHVQTSFHRPNLFLEVVPVGITERPARLESALREPGRFPAVVYVTLQETAMSVSAALQQRGFAAKPYHAGLNDDTRSLVQDEFMHDRIDIIVATIAFGMGIDKPNIRSVFHYNLPKSLENYQQEIGRAGRDGQPSHCCMLACGDDITVIENFVLGDTPDEPALRLLVDHLVRQGDQFEISRYHTSRSLDVRPLVLETVITYLEKAKILRPLGAVYSGYQIAFHNKEERVISGHTPDRQRFLKRLFDSGNRGWKWLTIDIGESSAAIGESAVRIRKAIDYLAESGDIEVRPAGLMHRFELLPEPTGRPPHEIAAWLHTLFTEREQKDLQRLQLVPALATEKRCLTQHLLKYFGEKNTEPCGHCDRCINTARPAKKLPRSVIPEITLGDIEAIQSIRRENHAALRGPRALARFLCGLSSPATTRDKLTRHDAFGRLSQVPFQDVLEQVLSNQ